MATMYQCLKNAYSVKVQQLCNSPSTGTQKLIKFNKIKKNYRMARNRFAFQNRIGCIKTRTFSQSKFAIFSNFSAARRRK